MDIALLRHSIATPLSTILINLELALACVEQEKPPAKINFNHHLKLALKASQYLKQLINQDQKSKQKFLVKTSILEISQIPQRINSNQLINYINISDKLKIAGNKLFFQESLICLINNAFESYKQKSFNRIVILKAFNDQKNLWINIVDGGCGMNWLSQKLATVDKISFKKNHTGIGLAFAKKTIEKKFAGQLLIKSKKNSGTTISLKIPLLNTL
jgi:signal transduction histidine kinase